MLLAEIASANFNGWHAEQFSEFVDLVSNVTNAQAEYLGVPQDGPYKPEHYRY